MLLGTLGLFAVSCGPLYAQCGGTFGEPIINITFGNVANPMTQLPPGTTTYILHTDNSFMNPEYYKITNNAINGYASDPNPGSNYHNITDHTGDPGGNMLLVNASYDAGIFYQDTVRNLCANTDFSFSAWFVNASPAFMGCGATLPINIEFEIQTLDGEVLAVAQTGERHGTSNPQWEQFVLSFNTGIHSDVRLIMRNVGDGGCGNNLAIDDIQFSPCGPPITLLPDLEVYQDTVFLCIQTNEVTFSTAIGAGYNTTVYQWQERMGIDGVWSDIAGATDSTLRVAPAHNTWYRLAIASDHQNLANPYCRVASAPMRAAHAERPVLTPTPVARRVCLDEPVSFTPLPYTGSDVGPLTYQWYVLHDGEPLMIGGADTEAYAPPVNVAGIYYYERRAINVCGQDFLVDSYSLEVLPMDATTFVSPVDMICIANPPMALSGGLPAIFASGDVGTYSGVGVEDGVFYPERAGIGDHEITYTPPSSVPCPVSSTAIIRVAESIRIEPIQTPILVLSGDQVQLNIVSNGERFVWAPANGLTRLDTPNPVVRPTETTTYEVTVYNEAGCELTTQITVQVLDNLQIPTGFTPNGDGYNDVWNIEGITDYPDVSVEIYNRWGTLLFSSNGYGTPWDGQFNGSPLPDGAYFFVIKSSILTKPLTGSVLIIR